MLSHRVLLRALFALSSSIVFAACATAMEDEDVLDEGAAIVPGPADSPGASMVYTTAGSVGALLYAYVDTSREKERSASSVRSNFASIRPSSTAGEPWQYIRTMSALGHYGPLGEYGPLGALGPLGNGAWSPEHYVSGGFSWANWSESLGDGGGPLSADGPLGSNGPLGQGFDIEDPSVSAFEAHLWPGGVFAALGPVGPLGPLGPLGALGPIGAHGYRRESTGEYVPRSGEQCHDAPEGAEEAPCRLIDVPWDDSEVRTYELVERYTESHAASMSDNDTSFMVDGEIADGEPDDRFEFTSRDAQWVTIVLTPISARYPYVQAMSVLGYAATQGYAVPSTVTVPHVLTGIPVANGYEHSTTFDDFDLSVEIETGGGETQTVTIDSASANRVDFVHVLVPAGARLRASVILYSQWTARGSDAFWGLPSRFVPASYRLTVVGSTANGVTRSAFSGPYLRAPE
jgi:hypothetical protein